MKSLEEGMILYHGIYVAVEKPDLDKCAKHKDFGQGFYLTTSLEQAISFARLSLGKVKDRGVVPTTEETAWVSSFHVGDITGLKTFVFQTADKEWLHCIVGHRREYYFKEIQWQMKDYDVIGGKVANDDTNFTITNYINGAYGPMGSEEADNFCIALLIPERLKDQFCFRSRKAIACLTYLKSDRIKLRGGNE